MNKDAESMDADDNVPSRPQSRAAKRRTTKWTRPLPPTTTTAEGEKEGEEKEGEEEKKEDEPEPEFEILTNPSRVTPATRKVHLLRPSRAIRPVRILDDHHHHHHHQRKISRRPRFLSS